MLFRPSRAYRKKKAEFSNPGPWPIRASLSSAEAVDHPIEGFTVGPLPSKNLGPANHRQILAHHPSPMYLNYIRGKPT